MDQISSSPTDALEKHRFLQGCSGIQGDVEISSDCISGALAEMIDRGELEARIDQFSFIRQMEDTTYREARSAVPFPGIFPNNKGGFGEEHGVGRESEMEVDSRR